MMQIEQAFHVHASPEQGIGEEQAQDYRDAEEETWKFFFHLRAFT